MLRFKSIKCKHAIAIFLLLSSASVSSQNIIPPPPCAANGNSGFGGAVGEGQFLFFGEDNNPIDIHMNTNNSTNLMDDILVLYIDTGAPGRNIIDETIDDSTHDHRIAITNSDLYGNGSNITFPSGFEASYAIAVDVNFGGGLYAIPSSGAIGDGDLNFVTSLNSTLLENTDHPYEISFYWEDIGLTMSDEIDIVGIYISKHACNSDEGYGDGIEEASDCKDDVIFTGYITLPGCIRTLDVTDSSMNSIKMSYFDNQLLVEGINELTTIYVYDIHGRIIYRNQHQIQESLSIPLELNANELQFIVLETSNAQKVLKVISN